MGARARQPAKVEELRFGVVNGILNTHRMNQPGHCSISPLENGALLAAQDLIDENVRHDIGAEMRGQFGGVVIAA